MANFNRKGGRRGRAMAMTSKTMSSDAADDHQAKEAKLILDRDSQQALHINPLRDAKGLPRLENPTDIPIEVVSCVAPFEDEHQLWPGEVIAALRAFSKTESGETAGRVVAEDDYVAIHRQIRSERSRYRDLDRTRVETGKKIRTTRDSPEAGPTRPDRKASCPLRTIMVRLMPHEAEIANAELDPESLGQAIDETVRAFEDAVGGEVVTAAVHRMRSGDLHIHIQFTMVLMQEESPTMKGRRLGPWNRMAVQTTREHLARQGDLSPGPRIVGRVKKSLVESGVIGPPPPPAPIYKKVKGKRSLGDGAILGYSFRQKINLVRLAEAAKLPDLAERVSAQRDVGGRFNFFRCQSDTALEADYLDLWLERVWRKSVMKVLPDDVSGEIKQLGVEAARDYATHGTVMVERTHLRKWKNKLSEKETAVEALEKNAEFRGLSLALEKLGGGAGGEIPEGRSAEEIIGEIDALTDQRAKLSELEGLRQMFRRLLPDEDIPHHDDAEECSRILSARLDKEMERLGGLEAKAATDVRDAHQGLEEVWSELGGTHELGSEDEVSESADKPVTISGWLGRIRNQTHHRIEQTKSGFLSHWLGMMTGFMHYDESVETKETRLEMAAMEFNQNARKEAWMSIFRHFNKNQDPEGKAESEIKNEVETTLRRRIGDGIKQGLASVFEFFGAPPPVSHAQNEIELALNQASVSHKELLEKEVLRDVLRVLQGGEFREEVVAGLEKAALKKLIKDAAEAFKGGVEEQQSIAVGKTARSIFGSKAGDHMLATEANPSQAIKHEIRRLRIADWLLERVLPLVPNQPAGSPGEKLIQSMRLIVGRRPVREASNEPQKGGSEPQR
jgi:hypothetical protein